MLKSIIRLLKFSTKSNKKWYRSFETEEQKRKSEQIFWYLGSYELLM